MKFKSSRTIFFFALVMPVFAVSLWLVRPVSAADSDDFVITVKTDNPGSSSSTEFTIPTYPGLTYNYKVDCDDTGPIGEVTATGAYTCTYGSAGTYTIRIKDNSGAGTGFPRIFFDDNSDEECYRGFLGECPGDTEPDDGE